MMLMSVGYAMGKLGWMTAREKAFLSKYIMNIAVPCNCVVGLLNNLSRDGLAQAVWMLLAAVLTIICTFLLSAAIATALRLPRERWGVFVVMGALSNTLFIGIPVCTQLFGAACMPYLMVYYLGNTSFLQSAGVLLIERAGTKPGKKTTVPAFLGNMFRKPPILAIVFAVVMLLLDLGLPQPILKFGEYISGSVSPMALIYCGFILYEVGLKELRFLPGLPVLMVLRLVGAPLVCVLFCRLFGVTGLARGVFLVESALPVVSQVPVMAGAYGADERYAATGACLTTLGSFVTIPILMLILGG